MTQIQTFVHSSVSNDFGLSVAQVAAKCKSYGRFSSWLNGDTTRIIEVLNKVKSNGVSPVFFAAYEKTEGYNSSWGWLNHTAVNGSPLTDADSVSKWVSSQSKNMSGGPAWIDYANYKDFVPASVKAAGNEDFKNMSSGSIGRVVIAGTAAATWEVYYPNGLKKEYNGVQNYGAPITGMMDTIISWGGKIAGGGGSKPALPVKEGTPITSQFGERVHPITGVVTMHNGTDFGGQNNDPIYATMNGTVYQKGFDDSRGNFVIIKHSGDSYYSTYMHMNSSSVSTGQTVTKGQQIGLMGTTGSSTGVHLHFAISTAPTSGYTDPEPYLATSSGGGGTDPDTPRQGGSVPSNTTSAQYKYEEKVNGMTYYQVKSGDNLSTIASKNKVSMNAIKRVSFSGIGNPDKLSVGEVLLLPNATSKAKPVAAKTRTYTVKKGDYLGKIAINLGVSQAHLIAKNNIKNPDKILVGQKLVY